MKILIVEDNPTSLKLVAEVLETAGMDVVRAVSAEDALALAEEFPADLVLTDIMLPGIDGFSLARKLKGNPATRDVPIVAMSANLLYDDELARGAGCETILAKPLNTRSLAGRLTEILSCAIQIKRGQCKAMTYCRPGADPGGVPLQVLIIEDDPTSLKLTGALLMSSGWLVSIATSAEQALVAVQANRPDMIVLDLKLPGADGLDFVQTLKHHATLADIPVLAVTAYPSAFGRDCALEAGCDAYLMKPIDTRQFPQQLQALLKASGADPEPQLDLPGREPL